MLGTAESLMNMRTTLRTITLLIGPSLLSKQIMKVRHPTLRSKASTTTDLLGVEQGYGHSAYPIGQGLTPLRRQVGPPERSNKRLLNGCYVGWRRGAFALTGRETGAKTGQTAHGRLLEARETSRRCCEASQECRWRSR
jgi:hypothetical protein